VNALDLARELVELDERIAAADERLSWQRDEVDRLAEMGVDTSAASTRVGDTTRALAAMRSRRRMILKKINVPL
jgi:hypothetical protein